MTACLQNWLTSFLSHFAFWTHLVFLPLTQKTLSLLGSCYKAWNRAVLVVDVYGGSADNQWREMRVERNWLIQESCVCRLSLSGEVVASLVFSLSERKKKRWSWLLLNVSFWTKGRFIILGIFNHDRSDHLSFRLSNNSYCQAVQVHAVV